MHIKYIRHINQVIVYCFSDAFSIFPSKPVQWKQTQLPLSVVEIDYCDIPIGKSYVRPLKYYTVRGIYGL